MEILKKIYEELVLIRKELQTQNERMELFPKITIGGKEINFHQENHD